MYKMVAPTYSAHSVNILRSLPAQALNLESAEIVLKDKEGTSPVPAKDNTKP